MAAASSLRRRQAPRAPHPWVIAHRGYRTRFPENTLAAFQAALQCGADMIELDVMLSKDRKLVVIHDPLLDRTTDGKGPVKERTLEEIKALDAGSWFDPRFKGERVPCLEEVLDLVWGRLLLNIEIKKGAYEPHGPRDAVENQVVDLVEKRRMADGVLVSSFEWRILENIVKRNKAICVAPLSRYPDEDHFEEACRKLGAFSWHPSYLAVRREHVEAMQRAGIRVFPYNADALEDIERMLAMGVDGVITSDPLLMKRIMKGNATAGLLRRRQE